jgi:hypothetical protein
VWQSIFWINNILIWILISRYRYRLNRFRLYPYIQICGLAIFFLEFFLYLFIFLIFGWTATAGEPVYHFCDSRVRRASTSLIGPRWNSKNTARNDRTAGAETGQPGP